MIRWVVVIVLVSLFFTVAYDISEFDRYCTPRYSETTEFIAELGLKLERAIDYINQNREKNINE